MKNVVYHDSYSRLFGFPAHSLHEPYKLIQPLLIFQRLSRWLVPDLPRTVPVTARLESGAAVTRLSRVTPNAFARADVVLIRGSERLPRSICDTSETLKPAATANDC
jgi:hypothetical protein